jgi:succinate dehydrogenase / fumarate reductase flavoprotein subunit
VVSRAIFTEVNDGRGCGPVGDYVMLKLDHLGEDVLNKRLPGITAMVKTFLGINPAQEPIPVYPTAHYTMGGIPTNRYGEVVVPVEHGEEEVPGLYAVGECACVSVHGANRLGGNSLLDIVVFGRAAGNRIIDILKNTRYHLPIPEHSVDIAMARLHRWDQKGQGESVARLKNELQTVMEKYCGVFRIENVLEEGLKKVLDIEARLQDVRLQDHSKIFNTARIEALELENLVDIAIATVASALSRQESRGAHSRIDFPNRDDAHWLKHSLYYKEQNLVEYKPVRLRPITVETFPPKERVY